MTLSRLLIFLLFIEFIASVKWCDEPPEIINPKIIGGQAISAKNFSFQVAVVSLSGDGYGMLCGGTVLDEFRVLTAAHCTGLNSAKLYVLLGLSSISSPEHTLKVSKFHRHPMFNEATIANDIAILEVKSSLFHLGATPICLTKEDSSLVSGEMPGMIAGFGLTIVGDTSTSTGTAIILARSDKLLSTNIPIISTAKCRTEWRRLSLGAVLVTEKQLCAGDVLKGSASGDSGGPLLIRDKYGRLIQVGITSFGASGITGMLDQRQYPGVYTRVSSYADWIDLMTSTSSALSLSLFIMGLYL